MIFDKPEFLDKLAAGDAFQARYAGAQEIPPSLMRAGVEFAKRGKVKYRATEVPGSGVAELTGTVHGSFGITYRPSLQIRFRGDRQLVERFQCGCREGIREHFCAHCAALLTARFPEPEARLQEDFQNGDTGLKGMRIRLGTQRKNGEAVFWTPEDSRRVFTPNAAVTGGADTGNTQVMKSIALQFLRQRQGEKGDTGLLILDWDGDYDESKTDFLEATGARVRKLQKLPLNPFSLKHLERNPQLPVHTAMDFADILVRAYGLGPLQRSTLANSVVSAYAAKGITSNPLSWDLPAPTFSDVYEEYCSRPQAQRSEDLSAVMDSLAAFELFDPESAEGTTLVDMFRGTVVIDMSG
jgi:DNA phosphorothioation-dependent restriction protein DptH